MQGNQGQVIQLLASGSCYGSCTRLQSSLIEVIFSAGRYLTTAPWPLLWQFEKLKEVCTPPQHSLLGTLLRKWSPWHPDVDGGTMQWPVGQSASMLSSEPRLPPAPTPPTLHHLWHRAQTMGQTLMLEDNRGLPLCAKTNKDLLKWFSSSHWWFSEIK